jgi:hypothetical protein
MKQGHVYNLLSQEGRHPKLDKNLKVGVLGLVMHLAPANRSGYEVCPGRSAGCTAACLNTAGFHYARKETARINRTKLFFEDRTKFMIMLMHEIDKAAGRAQSQGLQLGIRLNGTSDIPWERVPAGAATNLMTLFPEVRFMDYTKRANRKDLPPNYRLVFSRSEDNEAACVTALENGMNIAVVFRAHKDEALPKRWQLGKWHNIRVVDGDLHDWRYGEYDTYPQERVIIGLRSKGYQARIDQSGFVIDFPRAPAEKLAWDKRQKIANYQLAYNRGSS